MNRPAVTPTFQSARLAGWKTGATRLGTAVLSIIASWLIVLPTPAAEVRAVTPNQVLAGLRNYFTKTARDDGSFANGIDPQYRGMSDSAYSDLAAVTYAVTLHKTFGWKLPHEEATRRFPLSRPQPNGDFFNMAGTVDPKSAEGRVYNTTQGVVALRALGAKPPYDPLRVFEEILRQDYKTLPTYSTSFFPLAYLAYGQQIPAEADQRIRATMRQAPDGYLNDHVAATFHAAHYYRLVGEPAPMAEKIIERVLRDQQSDGSWMLNLPSRDRHATFDAVFTLRQLGHERADCQAAIQRAALWALTCRNADGGFSHFPGSTSDADANYFQAGLLVMAGILQPVDPLPPQAHLLPWGHLMPLPGMTGVGTLDLEPGDSRGEAQHQSARRRCVVAGILSQRAVSDLRRRRLEKTRPGQDLGFFPGATSRNFGDERRSFGCRLIARRTYHRRGLC